MPVPSAEIDPGIVIFDKCETEARQTGHLKRNIVARSINHCCSGKTIGVKYSDCVLIALFSQHEF